MSCFQLQQICFQCNRLSALNLPGVFTLHLDMGAQRPHRSLVDIELTLSGTVTMMLIWVYPILNLTPFYF